MKADNSARRIGMVNDVLAYGLWVTSGENQGISRAISAGIYTVLVCSVYLMGLNNAGLYSA